MEIQLISSCQDGVCLSRSQVGGGGWSLEPVPAEFLFWSLF